MRAPDFGIFRPSICQVCTASASFRPIFGLVSSYSGVGSLGGSQQFRCPELFAMLLDNWWWGSLRYLGPKSTKKRQWCVRHTQKCHFSLCMKPKLLAQQVTFLHSYKILDLKHICFEKTFIRLLFGVYRFSICQFLMIRYMMKSKRPHARSLAEAAEVLDRAAGCIHLNQPDQKHFDCMTFEVFIP